MTYDLAVRKAIELRKNNSQLSFASIAGYEHPKTNKEFITTEMAIGNVALAEYLLYRKHHPQHSAAVLIGKSNVECFRIWKEEGGIAYLEYLTEEFVKEVT